MNARDELARAERLCQVIVGAHLESDDTVDLLALCGEHDDRDGFACAAKPPAYREAILSWEHQIEYDEMRWIALQLLVEIASVGQHGNLKPLFGEVARQ